MRHETLFVLSTPFEWCDTKPFEVTRNFTPLDRVTQFTFGDKTQHTFWVVRHKTLLW